MNQNSQHMPIFTIAVEKKILMLSRCPCVVLLEWGLTVSNTQKCTGWLPLPPVATWAQHSLLGQRWGFGYAASEAAPTVCWLSVGVKPRLASLGESWQPAEPGQALLCCLPRTRTSVHSAGMSEWLLQRVTLCPWNHWCWMPASTSSQTQIRLRLSSSSNSQELTAQ